jgi:AraC family transcriptional regulator of arabinose operon
VAYDGTRFVWENRQARSERVCIGEVLYAAGGTCGPRIQRDYELVFLHSGELMVHVDDCRHALVAGCVARFLPGHREHFQFSATTETHHSWCVVAPGAMPPPMRRALRLAPFSVPYSSALGHLLAAGLAMGPVRTRGATETLERLGLLLFGEYLNAVREHHDTHDSAVRRAARFLAEHFAERDSLQQAHRIAGVSRNTLTAHFQREMKTTPARYLWRLRTERGIQMLAETGLSVAEIAFKCGFQDAFHFSRLVKQLQGIPPREVRRRAWSSE